MKKQIEILLVESSTGYIISRRNKEFDTHPSTCPSEWLELTMQFIKNILLEKCSSRFHNCTIQITQKSAPDVVPGSFLESDGFKL